MPGSLLCSAAGSFICHNAGEDCVSWSEGEWKINPNCSLKSWLIIKGRSLRMILIHKRLMMSLKRSHAIWKILEKSVPSFIYINSSLSEYDPLEISNEGLSSHSTPLWKISLHQLFSRRIPKGRVNKYEESVIFFFSVHLYLDERPGEVSLSAKHFCSFTSKQLNKPQKNWQFYSLKKLKILLSFYLSWVFTSVRAFEGMQKASVQSLLYLAACSDLDFYLFCVWSRILCYSCFEADLKNTD